MSKMCVFSVYDSKAEAYAMPFFQKTIGLAIRSFEQAAKDPESNLYKYPGDFTLFQIGEFDEIKGVLVPLESHTNLGNAVAITSTLKSAEE